MPHPVLFPSPWRELARHYNGVERLRRQCAVSYSTLHRWAHGSMVPSPENQAMLRTMFDAAGLPNPFPHEQP